MYLDESFANFHANPQNKKRTKEKLEKFEEIQRYQVNDLRESDGKDVPW